MQASSFTKEIEFLQCKDPKLTPPTYVAQFGLYRQEGVLRCKGRLNNSPLPENSRNPILIPASHEFVQLLIEEEFPGVSSLKGPRGGEDFGKDWFAVSRDLSRKSLVDQC